MSYALNGKRGKRDDGESETFIAETVRSHPRPGSNSNGNLVASFHATQDPIHHHHHHHALGHEGAGVAQGATVRRLTPTECERLQGFPDGWTAPAELGGPGVYRRGKRTKAESGEEYTGWVCVSGVSDSKRYAALGDAVTVPVAEWIGRRMLAG